MNQKTFNYITGVIFSIIATLHLIRSILGWKVLVAETEIVVGVSVVAFICALLLAYSAFALTKGEPTDKENTKKNTPAVE
jgi:hypothetical protein